MSRNLTKQLFCFRKRTIYHENKTCLKNNMGNDCILKFSSFCFKSTIYSSIIYVNIFFILSYLLNLVGMTSFSGMSFAKMSIFMFHSLFYSIVLCYLNSYCTNRSFRDCIWKTSVQNKQFFRFFGWAFLFYRFYSFCW